MTFPSPSRRATIEIWQTRFDSSWKARVTLVTSERRTVLFELPREAYLYFVHVHWSPDETRVGVLATGFNYVKVAYDLKIGKPIPYEVIRKDLSQSIRDKYNVPQEDPIRWAESPEAGVAFFKLHPEIRVSYH